MIPLTEQDKDRIRTYLKTNLEPGVFETWCSSIDFEPIDDQKVAVPTATAYHRRWLEKLLHKPIEDAFQHLFGQAPEVVFQVAAGDAGASTIAPPPPPPPTPVPAAPVMAALEATASSDFILNPAYTFENFIEGMSNRMALAAARAVADNPGSLYNPLFIHGGVGLGKTHLLQAVCQAILQRRPEAKVIYLSCEDFVNAYVYALRKGQLESFRARYRKAGILVMDDIHFLAEKEGSQEEFFHTFNAIHLAGRQIILSSDQPAQDIRSLTRQLLSRFRSGFEARIMAPNYETRLAILRRKADVRNWEIPQEVLEYVASVVETNIRELEGALTQVVAYAGLAARPFSLDLAKEVLRESEAPPRASTSVAEIQRIVARYYEKRVSDFQSRRWTKSTSQARQMCIYLCRKLTGASLEELGRQFGGKDHSTMLYSIRKIEKLLPDNTTLKNDLETLKREITRR